MHLGSILKNQRFYWSHQNFTISVMYGIIFLCVSLVLNFFPGTYAPFIASTAVQHILLDFLPRLNVEIVFVQGIVLLFFLVLVILFYKPEAIPFVLKSLALFVFIRSFFIILTHLAPFTEYQISSNNSIVNKFTFGGDLFFSAHTGIPFLMALIFWGDHYLRVIFVLLSLLFAAAVLFGHLHYSIDVFAAFFITYTIFHVAAILFAKDFKRLDLPNSWFLRFSSRLFSKNI